MHLNYDRVSEVIEHKLYQFCLTLFLELRPELAGFGHRVCIVSLGVYA